MALFWLIAGSMIVAALAFVAWPLWRARADPTTLSADQVDVTLYQRRRAELAEDHRNGLLNDQEFQEAREELDRQLLTDTEHSELTDQPVNAQRKRARWPLITAALALPLIAVGLYLEVGGGSTAINGKTDVADGEAHDLRAMISQLEDRLEANPDDGEGWLMLGRSYANLDQPKEAVRALSRAHSLLGDQPGVLVAYARALAASREPRSFDGRPAELVERALETAPQHPQALWLAGVAAAQRGEYARAVERWQSLLAQVPPESEDARIIQRNMAAVRERINGQQQTPTANAGASTGGATDSTAAASPSIEVTVRLAEALRDRITGDEPVFIFAKAVDGPPMPLAVVRRQASDLPLTVTLDDSDAMMSGRGLSGQAKVNVIARVSKSGDAAARPGDLASAAQTVAPDRAGSLSLTIDTVVQ